ncbi:MAG: outer membrane beta-barrel protein [Chitinophagaceae bacterium]|nr:outer membrane beta-barrel protein [Chitinophagaceae bacterium]MBK8952347.1 outer membrane beta-barrel protein [Chitinophagaceae bacterium]
MLHLLRKKACINLSIVSAILALVLHAGSAQAQFFKKEMSMEDHDAKPYYFGISVGINLARFHTELHPSFLTQDSVYVAEPTNSGGLTLGLQATARLSNRFQLRFNPQLMFIERNIFYKLKYTDPIENKTDVTKKVESIIMSFPLQVKFQSDRIGNFRVYTLAGYKADIDMASNARARKAEDLVKIQKYDHGPEFGIGFNFFFDSFIFSPEIKISNGTGNLHARDASLKYSSVFDRIQSKMIVFTIHLEG